MLRAEHPRKSYFAKLQIDLIWTGIKRIYFRRIIGNKLEIGFQLDYLRRIYFQIRFDRVFSCNQIRLPSQWKPSP